MTESPAKSSITWPGLADQVITMEAAGLVTRTFRRLDRERQLNVIHAILDEMAEHGPEELSIKQVAEHAGVSVGSLYQYFGSRARMVDFAVRLCRQYMDGVIDGATPYLAGLALPDALLAYVEGGCDWCAQQASLTRLFARAAYRGDPQLTESLVRPVAATMYGAVKSMLERAMTIGEVRQDLDLDAAAGVVHALTILLGDTRLLPYLDAYFHLQIDQTDAHRVLRVALDLVMRGIGKS